jgi:hypothetical protein
MSRMRRTRLPPVGDDLAASVSILLAIAPYRKLNPTVR